LIKRLRIKFICVNMLFVTCMLAILFGTLTYFMSRTIAKEKTTELHRIAAEPGKKIRPYGGNTNGEYVMSYFTLEYGPDGKLTAFGSGDFDLSDEEGLAALYERVMNEEKADGVLKDNNLRYYRAETPMGEKLVFADTYAERATINHLIRSCMWLAVVSFAVFFAASLHLSRWAVRPVEIAWKNQKQFVADASHELKTPLTVIMSNAELLQQPGYDEAQRKKFSDSILIMSRQMRRLVESLLELARLDSVQGTNDFQELDFSALVEDCILPFEPLFFERGLQLESDVEKNLRVSGNQQALRQCVDILLDNAQKYSEPGAVRLCLRRCGRSAELTVANPAPALKRGESEDIFKRFYRRDAARTGSGSYGLGLPIAKGIVARHGGKISCGWEAGEILFTVTLPII